MPQRKMPRGRFLKLERLEARRLLATVDLVRDINQEVLDGDIARIYPSGSVVLFTQSSPGTGTELWITDGTSSGTELLKDVNPGVGDSHIAEFVTIGNEVFFAAQGEGGAELWKTNVLTRSSVKIKTVGPHGASLPHDLTVMNGLVYFAAEDGANGEELWRSDGTAAGTFMVRDINTGASSSSPSHLAVVDGVLYFEATTLTQGAELWRSNGTSIGTLLVRDIRTGGLSSAIDGLINLDGTLYFSANDGTTGEELWKSDGTTAGTVLVKDIQPGAASSNPHSFVDLSGKLFFVATDANGSELWLSEGTSATTALVADIHNGPASSDPKYMVNVNGTLFFNADGASKGPELWKSTGLAGTTTLVADLVPGLQGSGPREMINLNGVLHFVATTAAEGISLWKSNGGVANTSIVSSFGVFPAPGGVGVRKMVNANGQAFFEVNRPEDGAHLWKYDGALTQQVFQVDRTASSSPQIVMTKGDSIYFFADQFGVGHKLWKSNGSLEGTSMVATGIAYAADPTSAFEISGLLYFMAETAEHGRELWRSDGTAEGTYMVKDLQPGAADSLFSNFTNVNGALYFSNDAASGAPLWKSNGTATGTSAVIPAGYDLDKCDSLVNFNGKLYFSAENSATGLELWSTDGTLPGTVLIKDVQPGAGSSFFSDMQVVGNQLYFFALDSTNGLELWKSNGTTAGTVRVSTLLSTPQQLAGGLSIVYFYDQFARLWVSDGTAAGTKVLKTFDVIGNGNPDRITMVGNTAYFRAYTNELGDELWKSDGTIAGTVLVKDIFPGAGSSNPSSLAYLNGQLLFSANDGLNGEELWSSDGTLLGTRQRASIAPGSHGSLPGNFSAVGAKLFMTAISSDHSRELFVQSTALTVSLSGIGPRSTTIRRNGSQVEAVDDASGIVLESLELQYLQSIHFLGLDAGSDTLTIDYAFGGFFPLPGGLFVSGRGGADSLNLLGLPGMMINLIPLGSGLGNGDLQVQHGTLTQLVSFANFEGLSLANVLSVASQGYLQINSQTLTLNSQTPVNLGAVTQLNSGVLNSNTALTLGAGESLLGSGNIVGRFSGEAGSLLASQGGSLVVGSSNSPSGFFTNGEVQVNSSLVLLDANQAVLGELTTLGNGVSQGTIIASNGLIIDFGKNVVGFGMLSTLNSISKQLINNGSISGNSATQLITLTGYVKGVGTLNHVNLAGTYSPGFSPATVYVGSVTYAAANRTIIELGGLSAGTQFDQIVHSGSATLGGILDIDLIDGFVPSIGNAFTILTATDGIVGTFANVELPVLPSDRQWQLTYAPSSVILQVVQVNAAPVDIAFAANDVHENSPAGSVYGAFSTSDPDAGNTFTYALVSGIGSGGNSNFTIDANGQLKNIAPLDFETTPVPSIRVRSTDQGGLFFEKVFTVSVVDLPELAGLPQFGDGTAQRSQIQQIVVTFDRVVDIAPGAFSLTKRGPDGGEVTTVATPLVVQGQTVVTLTFSGGFTRGQGSLIDGYYQLTIIGARITRGGLGLDANQDGTGGDQFQRGTVETDNYFALYGDGNGDGLVDIAEFGQFRTAFGKSQNDLGYNRLFDYEGDGAIGVSDFGQFRNRFGKPKLAFV